MRVIDISMPLQVGMPAYPGDEAFRTECLMRVEGQGCSMTRLTMGTHTGTHIDAPRHFFDDPEADGAGEIALDVLCGPARVARIYDSVKNIGAHHLKELALGGVKRLLLLTRNSEFKGSKFRIDYTSFTTEAADYIRESTSIKLIGIDYHSIEPPGSDGSPVHKRLLVPPNPVVILENISLRHVEPGDYELYCLPLKITGADGAPARAVLVKR
jgi:arylformamidase